MFAGNGAVVGAEQRGHAREVTGNRGRRERGVVASTSQGICRDAPRGWQAGRRGLTRTQRRDGEHVAGVLRGHTEEIASTSQGSYEGTPRTRRGNGRHVQEFARTRRGFSEGLAGMLRGCSDHSPRTLRGSTRAAPTMLRPVPTGTSGLLSMAVAVSLLARRFSSMAVGDVLVGTSVSPRSTSDFLAGASARLEHIEVISATSPSPTCSFLPPRLQPLALDTNELPDIHQCLCRRWCPKRDLSQQSQDSAATGSALLFPQ